MVLQKVQYCTNLYKRIPSSAKTLQSVAYRGELVTQQYQRLCLQYLISVNQLNTYPFCFLFDLTIIFLKISNNLNSTISTLAQRTLEIPAYIAFAKKAFSKTILILRVYNSFFHILFHQSNDLNEFKSNS
ncbi:hypothetical protein BpHYR1_040881 [Brachionus plicatilis]|uniref:Uncharacterized protein n=1 Tax=Brachionus plicatilis TaxID=10195 RepID=A0A3M7T7X5_BRAPC|nr:hypothetical protein BpHYR1_040881 [Brachionus plicatilis]